MKIVRWLFSSKSKSKNIVPEIILLSTIVVISLVVVLISNLTDIEILAKRILGIAVLLLWIVFALPCVLRIYNIVCIKRRTCSKQSNFKHIPVKYDFEDVIHWVKNADIPDVIYVKGIKEDSIITIRADFEVTGKNGSFRNKEISINDNVLNDLDSIKDTIFNVCLIEDGKITILGITENNDPKLFAKMIK